jgi:hypothetical protein
MGGVMFNKILVTMLVLICSSTMVFAQTATLKPFGISPRDASKVTDDIFDRTYNGLLNVGVETKMYLKGTVSGATLAPTWTVTTKPATSTAAITTTVNMDATSQVAVFTPDVIGTYVVTFANGGKSASVTINAATYIGITDGGCALCHKKTADEWKKTGHYSLFEDALNGIASDHYASYCISCHTTGYDIDANNNGFDERGFVFPDTLFPGQYDNMVAAYPNAMKLARIQCESCHGPGSAHMGSVADNKIISTLESDNCAWCHDSGEYHVYPDQWDASRHANPLYMARGSSAGCAPCHSGSGFVEWVKGDKANLTTAPAVTPITCATCHEPHSVANENQLRTVDVTLGNGMVVTGGGKGKLCMNCHKGRRDAAVYTGPNFAYSSSYGAHHGPQADVLIGTNAPTFGKVLPTSAHFAAIEDACVGCHMSEGKADATGNIIKAGSHSFAMVSPEGVDNVKACEECHGDVGESFSEKKFFMDGVADHDGDGTAEGLQEEVEGLLDKLALLLPPYDSLKVDMSGKKYKNVTETEAKAAFNYFMIEEDRSLGVHNPAFAVSLLKVSIQALKNNALSGNIVEIADVPNDQGKNVRLIWNKMADDGIAIDPVATYIVKRNDGDATWTTVAEASADGSSRYALVVPTLYDSTAMDDGITEFKVVALTHGGNTSESAPAVGFSIDNLVPHAPGNPLLAQNFGNITLSWEAPADPDVNYYIIYRSRNVVLANPTTQIGTTTSLEFSDALTRLGSYHYQIRAVDFSGNMGELSKVVSATLTSVATNDKSLPTDYALRQNYPNPFNPDTKIDFSVKEAGHVTLTVYNTLGQIVSILVDEDMLNGNYLVNFNGIGLTSGEYFYRIEVKGDVGVQFQDIRKMVLMK